MFSNEKTILGLITSLNLTVIQLTNVSQNYKVCVNLEKDIGKFYLQHFAMNVCLHKECHIE